MTHASIVVQSHLSDVQIEMSFNQETANLRLNFVKWLIDRLDGNLDQRIDPDVLYKEFLERFENRKST